MNTLVVTIVAAAVVASADSAFLGQRGFFPFGGQGQNQLMARGAPLNPYRGDGPEVAQWMDAVGGLVVGPEQIQRRLSESSVYEDFGSQFQQQVAPSDTLWFEEFPHGRAVLNWQSRRLQQGLPAYNLVSNRPGFPFYQGN